jgi:c-di-GMP-binding flagellar brake protein YcgR
MITVPAIERVAEPKLLSGDRRSNKRYPIRLDVEYKLCSRGRVEHFGVGRTVDFSSGGVLFETFGDVPVAKPIDLAIKWPFLLDGECGLKLQLRGDVMRRDDKKIAVKIAHYEFRTTDVRSATGGSAR